MTEESKVLNVNYSRDVELGYTYTQEDALTDS